MDFLSSIVYGCISKTTSDGEIKALLRILVKALESFSDIDLIDSIIMCLTRLLPLLPSESKIHKFMFWIALSILQLEETQLYASGLALLEQNLHTLDHMLSLFETTSTHQQQTLEKIMMDAREPLEWQFKQLDASMGLSFKSNFNFALVGHLIKGNGRIFTFKLDFLQHHVMQILVLSLRNSMKCRYIH